jgi:hypothetical protein
MRKNYLKDRTRTTWRRIGLAAAVVTAATLFSTASFAIGTPEQRAACRSDVMRLCMGQLGSEASIKACMRKNYGQLSAGCKATLPKQSG